MPSIVDIPESQYNTIQVELDREGLVVDSRVIGWDQAPYHWKFSCSIEGRTLTVTRVDDRNQDCEGEEVGWFDVISFRIYDPRNENVPDFDFHKSGGVYTYNGLDGEQAPNDATGVVVDPSVRIIQEKAFYGCSHLKFCTMGDGVERIEKQAFYECVQMNRIRLSKSLQFIGKRAFYGCEAISEGIFLPPSLREIQDAAFQNCSSVRILMLPDQIHLRNVHTDIVRGCHALLTDEQVQYPGKGKKNRIINNQKVNYWLKHHYDDLPLPLHKICANPHVTVSMIQAFVEEHGVEDLRIQDDDHGFTPMHILSMNPHATTEVILAYFHIDPMVSFTRDGTDSTPLDYLLSGSQVDAIVHIIQYLRINDECWE